ncbi:hypothetical protein A4H97_33830 [Niastella yeongjuensis]|uniref:Zn-ribbon-containing protein n=1 Tax=Niastella yeongjuensis TaxID=354355 RepID=A0A1V9EBV6_9BACT|nr:DUF2310 family Zn-ribbon-containing protein [Niastella yeongjuensis]OQP43608.1 hypothetical protein A4H97_33830 [Niastella yeongjuensis]SEP28953.1 Predicted nucleic acid-binding protein, contains Zn-ribbon domain [Niastella yeongjuensis]
MENIIQVKFLTSRLDLFDFEIAVDFLRSLKDNGQVIDFFRYPIGKNGNLEMNALTIDVESVNEFNNSSGVNNIINKMLQEFDVRVVYEIISKGDNKVEKNIESVKEFVLYYGGYSPLKSLDNFIDIPLYFIPPTSEDGSNRSNIIQWERDYEAIYHLWFRGNFNEEYFYDQLSNYNSGLSTHGIEVAGIIGKTTGKNCYYYLYRYPIDENNNEIENCPKCNQPWKLDSKLFDVFEYKCKNCLLIS